MKISHLGAKDCVTGSCHLIETNPGSADSINILVDCGTAYGDDPELPFDQFPVAPDTIQYLFLTHAHIDHIGRVPDLIDAGFRGEIIFTHPTKALLLPMLHDAMSFSRNQRGRNFFRGSSRKSFSPRDNQEKLETETLEALIDQLSWGFELHETFTLKQGITSNSAMPAISSAHVLSSSTFPISRARISG